MRPRFPIMFVSFLLGSAILALVVAFLLPAFYIHWINGVSVPNVFLWISFGLVCAALLEIAIVYIPGMAGSRLAFMALLLLFLSAGGWMGKTRLSDLIATRDRQQSRPASFAPPISVTLPGLPEPHQRGSAHPLIKDHNQRPLANTDTQPTRNENRDKANRGLALFEDDLPRPVQSRIL